MTKNVQCRNCYINYWEAQTPYIANYKFSSTEHGEQRESPEKKPHQVWKPFLDALQIQT